jgi:hypothetical protein
MDKDRIAGAATKVSAEHCGSMSRCFEGFAALPELVQGVWPVAGISSPSLVHHTFKPRS